MPADVADQAISMYAEGATDAEVHGQFPAYGLRALSVIAAVAGRRRLRICAVPGRFNYRTFRVLVRRPASMTYWELRTTAKMLIQKHLESCYAADPVSGVLEFVGVGGCPQVEGVLGHGRQG